MELHHPESTKLLAVYQQHKLTEGGGKGHSQVAFFFFPQMAGCQSSGKSFIVYVAFQEKCLATGVEVEKQGSDGALGSKQRVTI